MGTEQTPYVPAIEDTELRRDPRTGYWTIFWTVPASHSPGGRARTKSYSCRTKDQTIAAQVRREYLTALRGAVRGLVTPTVDDLIEKYRRQYAEGAGIKPTQFESLKPVSRLLGSETVADLDGSVFAAYLTARTVSVSPGTVRRELGALNAVLHWAHKSGNLPRATVLPHVPLPQEGPPREYVLDAKDEALLHAVARAILLDPARPAHWRGALFVLIALNQAARSRAIETLTWDRVTFVLAPMQSGFSGQSTPVSGRIDFRDPGERVTAKRRVAQPISDRLLPILWKEWVRQGQPAQRPVLGTTGSTRKSFETVKNLAFGSRHGDLTRHDLRRTWATLAAAAGVDMRAIAGVLGDTLETTEKHYAPYAPDHLVAAINKKRA